MKQLIITTLLLIFTLNMAYAQGENCDRNQVRYQQLMKKEQYEQAYPIWKNQMEKCPSYVVNIYNHAEVILTPLIENATGAQKEQYINDLINSYDQRLKYFPENKNMFQGDKVSYQLQYGKIDSMTAYNKLKDVINTAMKENSKLSFKIIDAYFQDALSLYYYDKLSRDEYVNAYNNVDNAIQLNIDLRNEEKAPLEDKIYGVEVDGKMVKEPTPLNFQEKQIYASDTANIAYLKQIDTVYAAYFEEYLKLDCATLESIVQEGFASNKNSKEWVAKYYFMMEERECNGPGFAMITDQVGVLFPAGSAPTSGSAIAQGSVSGPIVAANKAYRSGNYSKAIELYQEAINEGGSNSNKASIALKIASAYSKQGSWSNVVTWANKALQYKPGYGAANELIAYAYYKGAGQVPGNAFKQRQAGWVAADYARRAGNYKAAAQYDKSAPSSQECFMEGVAKGSTVKVGGWINKTTTAKCVAR